METDSEELCEHLQAMGIDAHVASMDRPQAHRSVRLGLPHGKDYLLR
jgi:hypothetical protein